MFAFYDRYCTWNLMGHTVTSKLTFLLPRNWCQGHACLVIFKLSLDWVFIKLAIYASFPANVQDDMPTGYNVFPQMFLFQNISCLMFHNVQISANNWSVNLGLPRFDECDSVTIIRTAARLHWFLAPWVLLMFGFVKEAK